MSAAQENARHALEILARVKARLHTSRSCPRGGAHDPVPVRGLAGESLGTECAKCGERWGAEGPCQP